MSEDTEGKKKAQTQAEKLDELLLIVQEYEERINELEDKLKESLEYLPEIVENHKRLYHA